VSTWDPRPFRFHLLRAVDQAVTLVAGRRAPCGAVILKRFLTEDFVFILGNFEPLQ